MAAVRMPETRYARTPDGQHIAYQVVGDGPVDLVYIGPWVTHLEYRWELPEYASYLEGLAAFSRLILFDRRGMGLSDPLPPEVHPDLEGQIDDIQAVMDAVGSERAVIYGASESSTLAMLFAAMHPERTVALVLHGAYPSGTWGPTRPGDTGRTSGRSVWRRSTGRGGPRSSSVVNSLRGRTGI
jgi:pimeloyl-ACP methyl ester carboxylesterase